MAFTAKDVQALREKTGCGMMDCKKALTESDGDVEKAIEFLREKGLAAAAKKSGRIAAEGMVYSAPFGDAGVIIEVNSETDFVAKNEEFQKFVKGCAQTIAAEKPADVEALKAMKYAGTEQTVEEALRDKILTIGENLIIRRFAILEGVTESYIHGGGRIGVLVQFDTDVADKDGFKECAKDVAMQIAAVNPSFLDKSSVPEETIAKEKEILTAAAINEGKPANIAEKMVMGRIGKYYKENCLLEQEFVKNPDVTVGKYVQECAAKLGGTIQVKSFIRFEKGDGLQKREDNFAAEIAGMVK